MPPSDLEKGNELLNVGCGPFKRLGSSTVLWIVLILCIIIGLVAGIVPAVLVKDDDSIASTSTTVVLSDGTTSTIVIANSGVPKEIPIANTTINNVLWTGQPGSFAEIAISDIQGGLSPEALKVLYSQQSLSRAQQWLTQKKTLWCGTQQDPGTEPFEGVFPFKMPNSNDTSWPGACPNSPQAQELFNAGIAWTFLYNGNEAACAFRAASRIDPTCAMAPLGTALAMGPNINYAYIANADIYSTILESMAEARTILSNSSLAQPFAAPLLYQALSQRYCVDKEGALDAALTMDAAAAFTAYQQSMPECSQAYTKAIGNLAEIMPEDPNFAALSAGALMETPAWKWTAAPSEIDTEPPAPVDAEAPEAAADDIPVETDLEQQEEQPASSLIEQDYAEAHAILKRSLEANGNHFGLLHYNVHNLEGGSEPHLASNSADKLYGFAEEQGHAAHMRTHIDTRTGDYERSLRGNLQAIQDDAKWNIDRSGGGIMSPLYKYNAHNIATMAEAAQHAGNWQQMAAAIAHLSYAAGFPLLADPTQVTSLAPYLTRQVLQPLRFGAYENIINGTQPSGTPCPIQGLGANATIFIELPDSTQGTIPCPACGDARLIARTVAFARLGRAEEAVAELNTLLSTGSIACASPSIAKLKATACTEGSGGTPMMKAQSIAEFYMKLATLPDTGDNTVDLLQSETNTAGSSNADYTAALQLLVPAAEVAGALALTNLQLRLLREAVAVQNLLKYEQPAPFFYPVGETLAGVLMKQGTEEALDEATDVLRTVLYDWPYSVLPSLALAEVESQRSLLMFNVTQTSVVPELVTRAISLNDTVINLAWL